MKVAFFFPEHLRIDGNSPAYEVYLDKEKRQFITYNSLNQKWCEAKLDRLDWKRRYWYTKAYWVNDEKNGALYAEYKKLADAEQNVIFGGRLAEYRYYDMDAVIASALQKSEEVL